MLMLINSQITFSITCNCYVFLSCYVNNSAYPYLTNSVTVTAATLQLHKIKKKTFKHVLEHLKAQNLANVSC